MRLVRATALLAVTLTLSVACSSTPTVSQSDLEDAVTEKLTKDVGTAPDDVVCPEEGLEGEVGGTQRCVLTAGDDELGVDIVVTGVEGSEVQFDIAVDDTVTE